MTAPAITTMSCPSWCDRSAHEPIGKHAGDPTLHTQESLDVPVSLDGGETFLRLGLVRIDGDQVGVPQIGIALNDGWVVAGCSYDEEIRLSPAQARVFADVLNRLVDEGDAK